MLTCSLNSGSNGNCIYVEAGDVRLVFDAGISGRQCDARLQSHGRRMRDCHALILSHDHADHTGCAGVLHRLFHLPVYMSPRVCAKIRPEVGPLRDVRLYEPGETLRFGPVAVHTIRTPHDGIDTVCFLIEHENRRLGILTDLGHRFTALCDIFGQLDAAYLESNYDDDLLWNGSYPQRLKERIAGDAGHLSNDDAAQLAHERATRRLKWLAVAHLSEHNNRPDLALEAQRVRIGRSIPIHLAPRTSVSALLEV